MKKKIEGFEDKKELKIFENRLKNKNELIFHFWKISLDLALRVSDTLKITIKEANQYLKNGYYISKDKKTKKANQVHTYQANFKFNRKYDNLFQGLLEGGFFI